MTHFLDSLKQIISRHEAPDDAHATPRAAAILLIELAATDEGGEAAELPVIERAIRDHFGLSGQEVDELLAEAGRLQRQSVSLHDFTRQLRVALEPEGRAELIEWLWRG
ncbi:MAG: TerB family tellurite resistance protein, partial [Wenzhouxiangellaceae bacterium]